jgi:hypothetical protein
VVFKPAVSTTVNLPAELQPLGPARMPPPVPPATPRPFSSCNGSPCECPAPLKSSPCSAAAADSPSFSRHPTACRRSSQPSARWPRCNDALVISSSFREFKRTGDNFSDAGGTALPATINLVAIKNLPRILYLLFLICTSPLLL